MVTLVCKKKYLITVLVLSIEFKPVWVLLALGCSTKANSTNSRTFLIRVRLSNSFRNFHHFHWSFWQPSQKPTNSITAAAPTVKYWQYQPRTRVAGKRETNWLPKSRPTKTVCLEVKNQENAWNLFSTRFLLWIVIRTEWIHEHAILNFGSGEHSCISCCITWLRRKTTLKKMSSSHPVAVENSSDPEEPNAHPLKKSCDFNADTC